MSIGDLLKASNNILATNYYRANSNDKSASRISHANKSSGYIAAEKNRKKLLRTSMGFAKNQMMRASPVN